MKNAITLLICIPISIGIGWYCGYTRPSARNQRELLVQYQYARDHYQGFVSNMADFNKRQAEYFGAAKPYEASSASIALAALKNLDANDLTGVRTKLAATVAIYYHSHMLDGDTNLLSSIVNFAATDIVLSNAMHDK